MHSGCTPADPDTTPCVMWCCSSRGGLFTGPKAGVVEEDYYLAEYTPEERAQVSHGSQGRATLTAPASCPQSACGCCRQQSACCSLNLFCYRSS
jgi:hypothetical protein